MTINLKCEKFKNEIYDLINESELPIAVIYYILKAINEDMDRAYKIIIRKEIED